jgi:hypothetical protein
MGSGLTFSSILSLSLVGGGYLTSRHNMFIFLESAPGAIVLEVKWTLEAVSTPYGREISLGLAKN